MHHPGSIYIVDGTFHLLSRFKFNSKNYVVLIALDGSGDRWADPVKVTSSLHISDYEMELIAGGYPYELYEGKVILNEPH